MDTKNVKGKLSWSVLRWQHFR